jgi:hypothetical protein
MGIVLERKSFYLHLQSRFKGNSTSFDDQMWFVSVLWSTMGLPVKKK